MFAQINAYKNLIISGIIVFAIIGLYAYVHSLKTDIEDLRMQVSKKNVEIANRKLEVERYRSSLVHQNEKIEKLELDNKAADDKLTKWKNQPENIKYKVIYKTKEVKSNDCKDIKKRIDYVRHLNANELY